MINRMNNTTINAKPEEPWLYPLIGAPPLSMYPMHIIYDVVGRYYGGTFLF
ncbi:hypothetical protein H4683_001986 [Filibacter limicola]|uniref:Uncharacterized protein n=1 Tax=Sporosarcina limicola TaxID=34101 RepID=A0A927MJ64_9BACL|nr:hypothetical protein [Sporosarcina limicola]